MNDITLQITAFLITVLALVSVHEAGHMVVARWLGIKVLRYSIGFGKVLWSRTSRSGIQYVVSLLPLGGYVKLLDEREGPVKPSERHLAFNNQPLWKRTLVVLAGPVTNIVFAIFAYWLMFCIGYDTLKPIVYSVESNSPAVLADIRPDSEIVAVDGWPISTWQNVVLAMIERLGEKGSMTITTRPVNGSNTTVHTVDLSKWHIDELNPDPLKSLGISPYSPTLPAVLDTLIAGDAADIAGLKVGDKIIKIGDQKIEHWKDLTTYLVTRPNQNVEVVYERDGKLLHTQLTVGSKHVLSGFRKVGFIGVGVKPVDIPSYYKMELYYSLLGALPAAVKETYSFFDFNVIVTKKMLLGEISLKSLGGPISIFKTANQAFRQGLTTFLGFLALISVMLAFINVLPIPGLDGGHLLLFMIEAVVRKPLSLKTEILATRIGFIMLLSLMFAATFNDIMRIFS